MTAPAAPFRAPADRRGDGAGALAALTAESSVIEDWRPLGDSLEWALSRRYWDRRGLAAFLVDGVPYAINADGVAPAAAAELLIRHLRRTGRTPAGGATVLEIGAGSGLFARQLLRSVARRSPEWASSVTFVLADGSQRMIDDLRRCGVLRGLEAPCRTLVADADGSDGALTASAPPGGYDAVFLNYLLDTLPFTALEPGPDDADVELRVRTVVHGPGDAQLLRELAEARTPEALDRLLDMRSELRLELGRFRYDGPDETPPRPGARLAQHGAIGCLETCMAALASGGFVLLRDYPFTPGLSLDDRPLFQAYAGSTAVGLDFETFEHAVRARDWAVAGCDEDDEDIRTRLVSCEIDDGLGSDFRRLFGGGPTAASKALLTRARKLAQSGASTAALAAYAELLAQTPDYWAAHSEAARLLIGQEDYARAGEVAAAGLQANPVAVELMYDLGDSLFLRDKVDEAHRWFQTAHSLAPASAQPHYNLSFTHEKRGEHAEALACIAAGFAADAEGAYRDRLLARQADVLAQFDRQRRRKESKTRDRFGPWRSIGPDGD